jgi:hypothetical protein
MVAPTTVGTYRITWQMSYGNISICTLTLDVVIK